ncbi:EcKinase, DUF1679, and/or APH domain containing protein [Asbolus verrucosus]|uniref:EcKinase, DUF1679, and/or APH domain containing protein n=1 Tax=Asbolus verrucosus TaxID=1661398 RepID=A0A482VXL2_ASBVE|nr:EcKinase, DUF1679, and/or APH domain containing protein [Asbolus verrucosus]
MEMLQKREDIVALINDLCREKRMLDYSFTTVKTNKEGEGYLGYFFMVTIKDNASGKELDVAIKAAFTEDSARKTAGPVEVVFENEIYFYTEVYPAFKSFEKDLGISQTMDFVAECFKVSREKQREILVFENLTASNFEVFPKKLFLDFEHISLIFKTYARFHAYSFALRDQRPEEYANLINVFQNTYAVFLDVKNSLFKRSLLRFAHQVEEYLKPGEDDLIIEKYKKYRGDAFIDQFRETIAEPGDYSAILHGDCWSNNLMFKYEATEDGKKPIDMRLLDWQFIKIGSPVCDLSYCLYSGAPKEILDSLDTFLKIYYDNFSSFLKELGSDPEKLFPYEALKDHWKKYSRFGMSMAIIMWKVKLVEDEETYQRTIRQLLQHMSEIDVL